MFEQSTGLIALVRDRDPVSRACLLAHLWGRFHAAVVQRCMAAGLQSADADDIASGIWLRLADHIDGFVQGHEPEAGRRRFRPWLLTCTRNAISDHFSRRKRDGAGLPSDVPDPGLAEAIAADFDECEIHDEDLQEAVRRARERVSEQTWHLFVEREVHGRAYKDIVDGQMTIDAAEAAVRRVKRMIRSLYEARHPNQPQPR